jgi:16S rRNA (guanine966-N2)-methyltransferase
MYLPVMANNEVRIIGGQWRGRKLRFPDREGLRPTLSRVRETLFNWLAPSIHEARCLDLYAGSGALGFEALSRGAAEVTFVERDRKAAAALKNNAEILDARASVRQMTAERFLAGNSEPFDLILFDPPFADTRALDLLPVLLDSHLSADGLLYLETGRRATLPLPERVLKSSTAGDCCFALYQ